MSRIVSVIQDAVQSAVLAHVNNPGKSLSSDVPAYDAAAVARDVVSDLPAVVANLSNQEPWWQSRVTWGALIAIVMPLLRAVGVETRSIDPASVVDVIMSIAAAAGGILAIYGRYVAKKPIGA